MIAVCFHEVSGFCLSRKNISDKWEFYNYNNNTWATNDTPINWCASLAYLIRKYNKNNPDAKIYRHSEVLMRLSWFMMGD